MQGTPLNFCGSAIGPSQGSDDTHGLKFRRKSGCRAALEKPHDMIFDVLQTVKVKPQLQQPLVRGWLVLKSRKYGFRKSLRRESNSGGSSE